MKEKVLAGVNVALAIQPVRKCHQARILQGQEPKCSETSGEFPFCLLQGKSSLGH